MRGEAATTPSRTALGACARRTGSRRGGPSGFSGRPIGTTATGTTCAGQREQLAELGAEARGDRRERAAEPERGRGEQQVLHRREDRRRRPSPRGRARVSAHTTMCTGAAAIPPVAPRSTSASSFGVSRVSENARPCPPTRARVRSPIAARAVASRTTTNSHGWRFSALGASVAASSSRAMLGVGDRRVGERAVRALAARRRRRESVAHGAGALRRRGRTSSRT